MILVTVGTQLPFPRLIKAMDDLAPSLGVPVVAQVGADDMPVRNIERHASIEPTAFAGLLSKADVVVSHAGIGSVLTAKNAGKPIILFPRLAALREHRNDHQLATVKQLEGRRGIYVARDEAELAALLRRGSLEPPEDGVSASLSEFRAQLTRFIRA